MKAFVLGVAIFCLFSIVKAHNLQITNCTGPSAAVTNNTKALPLNPSLAIGGVYYINWNHAAPPVGPITISLWDATRKNTLMTIASGLLPNSTGVINPSDGPGPRNTYFRAIPFVVPSQFGLGKFFIRGLWFSGADRFLSVFFVEDDTYCTNRTKTPSPLPSATSLPSYTPSLTPTPTSTPSYSSTTTPTETPSSSPTDTPTYTSTPSSTSSPTDTSTYMYTPTSSLTPTDSSTYLYTATEAPSASPMETPTSTYTSSPTSLPSYSHTPTPGGQVHGDPHLSTLDGMLATYVSCGDYVMMKSDDGEFQYQARHCLRDGLGSSTCAVALRCSSDSAVIELYTIGDKLKVIVDRVDATSLKRSGTLHSRSVTVVRRAADVSVKCDATGFVLKALLREASSTLYFDTSVSMASAMFGKVRGLLGSWDGIKENDISYANGGVWQPGHGLDYVSGVEHPELAEVEASWLVPSGTSLFTLDNHKAKAECNIGINNQHRHLLSHMENDGPEMFAKGYQACIASGIPAESIYIRTCMFDYVASGGNAQFVKNSVNFVFSQLHQALAR